MELLTSYLSILKDPSLPENRVVRKTAALALILTLVLVYYRHFTLKLGTGEPLLVTAFMALTILGPANVFIGIFNGAFYRDYLRDTGAQRGEQTLAVFMAEWLFAGSIPIACFIVGTVAELFAR